MASKSGFGNWFYGFLTGGVVGIATCAIAAFFITNTPIPFVNKVDQASEKINPIANGNPIDPNERLNSTASSPNNVPKSKVTLVEASSDKSPTSENTKVQPEDVARFVVQAGAFRSEEAAEGRRAELGMIGFESRIIPKTDSTGTVYRVRLGPYGTMNEASEVKRLLLNNSIPSEIGRIR